MKIDRRPAKPKAPRGSSGTRFTPAVLKKIRERAHQAGGSRWTAYAMVAKKLRGPETVDLAAALEGYGKIVDLLDFTSIGKHMRVQPQRSAFNQLGDHLEGTLRAAIHHDDRKRIKEALGWPL